MSNARIAYQFYLKSGLTPAQAAGLVGNLQQESGENLNTAALNKGEQAFGIAQWRKDRRSALEDYARSMKTDVTDLKTQLAFSLHELNTTESRAKKYLSAAQTPEEAAMAVDRHYERSAGKHTQQRMTYARSLLDQFGGNDAVATLIDEAVAPSGATGKSGKSASSIIDSAASEPSSAPNFSPTPKRNPANLSYMDQLVEMLPQGQETDWQLILAGLGKGLGQLGSGQAVDLSAEVGASRKDRDTRQAKAEQQKRAGALISNLEKMEGGDLFADMLRQGADPEMVLKLYQSGIETELAKRGLDQEDARRIAQNERDAIDSEYRERRANAQDSQFARQYELQQQQFGLQQELGRGGLDVNRQQAETGQYAAEQSVRQGDAQLVQQGEQFDRRQNTLSATDQAQLASQQADRAQRGEQFNTQFSNLSEAQKADNLLQQQQIGNTQANADRSFNYLSAAEKAQAETRRAELQTQIYQYNTGRSTISAVDAARLAQEKAQSDQQNNQFNTTRSTVSATDQAQLKEQRYQTDAATGLARDKAKLTLSEAAATKNALMSSLATGGATQLADLVRRQPPEFFMDNERVSTLLKTAQTTGLLPPEATSKMIEYQSATRDPAFGQYLRDLATAGAQNTQVTIGNKVEVAEAEDALKVLNTDRDALGKAQAMKALASQMREVSASAGPEGMRSGPITSGMQNISMMAAELGLVSREAAQNIQTREQFAQFQNQLFPQLRTLSGSTSDKDAQDLKAATPSIANSPEAIDFGLRSLERTADRAEAKFYAKEQWYAQNKNLIGFEEQWRKRSDAGDPATKPIVYNLDRMDKTNIMQAAKDGDISIGGVVVVRHKGQLTRLPVSENVLNALIRGDF